MYIYVHTHKCICFRYSSALEILSILGKAIAFLLIILHKIVHNTSAEVKDFEIHLQTLKNSCFLIMFLQVVHLFAYLPATSLIATKI